MQLEEFFNLSSDMFCIAGTDGYFKKVNPAFCNLLGYSEKELLSKPYTSFIYAEDVSALAHIGTQLGPETRFENRYVCSDGSIKWVSWSRWVRSADSTLIYASGRDVSQEKILEERLQISLKEKQQILDSSVDIILTINGQGEYLSVSKAVEHLWCYNP